MSSRWSHQNDRRRRAKYKPQVLALDPGATISGGRQTLGGRSYDLYSVKDSAGVEIGWTEGNEQGEAPAWLRALGTLEARAKVAGDKTLTDALKELGIRHEPKDGHRRTLYRGDECLGDFSASEGWVLVAQLRKAAE